MLGYSLKHLNSEMRRYTMFNITVKWNAIFVQLTIHKYIHRMHYAYLVNFV